MVSKKENKKIKNARTYSFEDVTFKSKFEASSYKYFKENGLNPQYQIEKIILLNGFRPSKIWYVNGIPQITKNGISTKITDITYSPDFKIETDGFVAYIEIKGFPNDVYPYKRKLFLKKLETIKRAIFFEVKNEKGLKETVNIIKELMGLLDKIKSQISILPEKDIKYAEKFIAERDFESLFEIVKSDIEKLNRKRNKDGYFDDELGDVDFVMVKLDKLAGDIMQYITLIDPQFTINEDEDFNEELVCDDDYY